MRADQRFSYRRLIGDFALQAVCLCGTYDLEFNLLIKLYIIDVYLTSYIDSVGVYLILYDNFGIFQDLFDLLDTCLNVSLLILRCIVLCVLGQVSLLSRFLDFLSDFFSAVYLQIMKLLLQFLESCISKNIFFFFYVSAPFPYLYLSSVNAFIS